MFRHAFAVALLVIVTVYIAGCTSASPRYLKGSGLVVISRKPLPGGWLRVQANDEIYRLARFAMRDVPEDSVKKVHTAKAQEVIGLCYLLSFQMNSGKQWQAELYKDPGGNITLLEILALQKNKTKKKR